LVGRQASMEKCRCRGSWAEITPSSITSDTWVPYDICVSGSNPDHIWLTRTSQYSTTNLDGNLVYKSDDGGSTWTNITTSVLDGEAPTNIRYQLGSPNGIYLGTRRAVYYISDNLSDWELFNVGLPVSTTSVNLVPNYDRGKIINGTNRSAWESDFYEASVIDAQIAANKFVVNCLDETVEFYDHSVVNLATASWNWDFPGATPSSSTDRNPVVTYDTPGTYDVSMTVTDVSGTDVQSYQAFITYDDMIAGNSIAEDFESSFSTGWTLFNSNSTFNWHTMDVFYGPDCEPTMCASVNNFDISADGDEGELISPKIDLTFVEAAELKFDYAYANYGGQYSDGLRIDVSLDCGGTWTELWEQNGQQLSTVPDQTSWWEPTDCSEWDSVSIDMSAYQHYVIQVRFVNVNGFGNNMYLDNINMDGLFNSVDEVSGDKRLQIVPNPNTGWFDINTNMDNYQLDIYNNLGQVIYTSLTGEKPTFQLAVGQYYIRVVGADETITKRVSVIR